MAVFQLSRLTWIPANDIATTYNGMRIALPETEWHIFSIMSRPELAKTRIELAQYVRLEAFRKSPTRARKSRSQPEKSPKKGHVSTAKVLKNQMAKYITP